MPRSLSPTAAPLTELETMGAVALCPRALALMAGIASLLASACASTPGGYDKVVLADAPVAYWPMSRSEAGVESSLCGAALTGKYVGKRTAAVLPNGDAATAFDGATGYFEVADDAVLSPTKKEGFTLEAWMRPDTLDFAHTQGSGYVYWMGKGEPNQYEYVARMYSGTNSENRHNRISGYAFDLSGGLGAGSNFEDPIAVGTWIHYVLVIQVDAKSPKYPNGYTKIYRDGVLRDQDDLSIHGDVIVPARGSAPFRVGTRDFGSWFQGAVGKVAIYDKELSPSQIARHGESMRGR